MTTTDTKGWDIVTGITQASLNTNLISAFNQDLLPKHIEHSAELLDEQVTLDIDIGPPSFELGDLTSGLADVAVPVTAGFVKFGDEPFDLTGSTIEIATALNQIELTTEGKKQVKVYLDLLDERAVFSIKVDGLSDRIREAILNAILVLALKEFKPEESYFVAAVDLERAAVPDYILPKEVGFTMFSSGENDPDLNALLILLRSLGSGGSKAYEETVIPAEQDSAILLSQERLLSNFVADQIREQVPDSQFNYADGEAELAKEVPYDEYAMRNIVVSVKGNEIHILFDIAARGEFGGGINVYVEAPSTISLSIETDADGNQTIVPTTEAQDTDSTWTLEWWVYGAIVASGGTVLGVVGPIIAVIVTIVVGVVAASVGGEEAKGKLEKKLKEAATPVLWPGGDTYRLTGVSIPGSLLVTGHLDI